jgi:hypothetical protein
MKSFAAAVASLGLVAAAAAAPDGPPVRQERGQPPGEGLRQVLQDFFRNEPSPPPRQLSPGERAELRRQLSEHARTPSRRH